MKRTLALGLVILCLAASGTIGAQESLLRTYQRNFARASLSVKLTILQEAAEIEDTDMGPLFLQAVEYVLDNSGLIQMDSLTRQLSRLSVELIGREEYVEAKYVVWKLFESDSDTSVRVAVMDALGVIGRGDTEIIRNLNAWLHNQNAIYKTGTRPDLQVVDACVVALGRLGDPSSFPVLFTAMVAGYADTITTHAAEALFMVEGDLAELFIDVIHRNPLSEKLQALTVALEADRLTDDQKAQVAEVALDIGLHTQISDASGRQTLRRMRTLAVNALAARNWSQATNLAIEHFNLVLQEYDRGIADKTVVQSAIGALGAMETTEAAERLTLYLELLNSYTENDRPYDEQIVLAVIRNLGALGDKVAFDYLLYTTYLDYPEGVKQAAREALNNLKW
jgi:hypothetical protein